MLSDRQAMSGAGVGAGAGGDGPRRGVELGSARHHRNQCLRNEQRKRHVHEEKQHDRGHAEEMHQAGALEVVEQRRQLRELHRLPDDETRDHLQNADQDDADIERALHGVVAGEIVVREVETQGVAHGGNELAQADRQQHAAKAAADEPVDQIGNSVDRQDPHPEKMPLQRALRLAADGDPVREMQPAEQHLIVIDLPPAADHDDHGDGVGPMHDAQRQRMQPQAMPGM